MPEILASAGQYAVFEIERVGTDEWDARRRDDVRIA